MGSKYLAVGGLALLVGIGILSKKVYDFGESYIISKNIEKESYFEISLNPTLQTTNKVDKIYSKDCNQISEEFYER